MPGTAGGSSLLDGLLTPVRESPVRWMGALVLVLALGVSGLFGGLDKVEADATDTAAVGSANEGDPWTITIQAGRIAPDLPPLQLTDPANRWLAIVALVEVTADESRADIDDALSLDGVKTLSEDGKASDILYMRDARPVSRLHPGMPEQVAFFWEQAASEPVPTEVTAVIWGKTLRPLSWDGQAVWPDDARPTWLDRAERARTTVKMDDKREAATPSATPSRTPSATPSRTASPSRPPTSSRPPSPSPSASRTR